MSRVVDYPEGVETVDEIEDAGVLVRLSREVDLDDLLLALAQQFGDGFVGSDWPTYIAGALHRPEASVEWFRKQPCTCGAAHQWDMAYAQPHEFRDEKPTGKRARGAFLGVFVG